MHEQNVSQGQHDSLCGTPSHFLPQKHPSPCGPSKGLSHPPLDGAALPNHSLVEELSKRQIKITRLKRKWLHFLHDCRSTVNFLKLLKAIAKDYFVKILTPSCTPKPEHSTV